MGAGAQKTEFSLGPQRGESDHFLILRRVWQLLVTVVCTDREKIDPDKQDPVCFVKSN